MRIDYKEYMLSQSWKDKKQELFDKVGKECEQCGSTYKIQVHHKTYKSFGNENLRDLQVLCFVCHMSKHEKYFNKYILKHKPNKKTNKRKRLTKKQKKKIAEDKRLRASQRREQIFYTSKHKSRLNK